MAWKPLSHKSGLLAEWALSHIDQYIMEGRMDDTYEKVCETLNNAYVLSTPETFIHEPRAHKGYAANQFR